MRKMKRRINQTAAGLVAAAVLLCCRCHAAPALAARHAVLMDADSGRILFAHRAEEPALLASTTKIMTGLLVAEQCDLADIVLVPPEAVGVEGSSLHLQEGDSHTVEMLLYGLMLHSGNDAAVALAIHCCGSQAAFVKQMNQRAQELNLRNTVFSNPHGLDAEQHHSSARDLAVLTAHAMENEIFRQVVSTRTVTLEDRTFTNHNKLLWQYEDTIGVKTGYTKAAGRILVSCAQRGERRLIAVTMDDPDDWKDHAVLLDYGFQQFRQHTVLQPGTVLGRADVSRTGQWAEAVTGDGFSYPVTEEERLSMQVCLPEQVEPPVLAGTTAGEVIILLNQVEIARIPLIWRNSVWEDSGNGRKTAENYFPLWRGFQAAGRKAPGGGPDPGQWEHGASG